MNNTLKVKICGMKYTDNIHHLVELKPDFIGFIFYPKSKRFVGEHLDISIMEEIHESIQKVGVFVNSSLEEITEKTEQFKLSYVQLHGDESPDFCYQLKNRNMKIIKVFRVEEEIKINELNEFSACSDYFLFDTQTSKYGGSGRKFNWDIFDKISMNKPFFLSGGIHPEDAEIILKQDISDMFAVDINSGFELEPGLKDMEKIKSFIKKIRGIA